VATLTVWKFPKATGADDALTKLDQLQRGELIKIHDAAVVSWEEGKKKPKTRQLHDLKGAGALGGAFWGWLFGLLFFVPLLGMAMGAAMGAMSASLKDVGIDDSFIDQVRSKVTPGTSALFLFTSDAVRDKVLAEFKDTDMELLHTNMSADQEGKLREAFAEDE
jgi:uncharacterized membrane protein